MDKNGFGKIPAQRQSNLELFRIVSILFIIAHHWSVHGNFHFLPYEITPNRLFVQFLALGGKFGVVCFLIVSGYFMVKSVFSIEKLLRLVLEVTFYSILLMLVFYVSGANAFSIKECIMNCLPFFYSTYWFFSAYIMLYIATPFINRFLMVMSKNQFRSMLFLLMILWSVLPTFIKASFYGNELCLFLLFYFLGAYFRLYPSRITEQCGRNFIVWIVIYLLMFGTTIGFDLLENMSGFFSSNEMQFMQLQSPFIILSGAALFLGFKNLRIRHSNLVNTVAASVFGVYLIHDNNFVRPFLWEKLFREGQFVNSSLLILNASIAVVSVFIVCTLFDLLRRRLIEKPLFYFYRKWEIEDLIKLGYHRVCDRVTWFMDKIYS